MDMMTQWKTKTKMVASNDLLTNYPIRFCEEQSLLPALLIIVSITKQLTRVLICFLITSACACLLYINEICVFWCVEWKMIVSEFVLKCSSKTHNRESAGQTTCF